MSSLPGASSGRSHVRGYSPAPVRSESHEPSQRDSGMGWDKDGRGRGTASKNTHHVPWSVKCARELAWAEKHLPDEYPGFVITAIQRLQGRGVAPSTGTVMAYLRELGRDNESVERRYRERQA